MVYWLFVVRIELGIIGKIKPDNLVPDDDAQRVVE